MNLSQRELVEKPWGCESRYAMTDLYAGKVIHIDRGCATSVQYHVEKDETLCVLSGIAVAQEFAPASGEAPDGEVVVLQNQIALGYGACVRFERGTIHRLVALTNDCVLLEVSTRHDDADTRRSRWKGALVGGQIPPEEFHALMAWARERDPHLVIMSQETGRRL